MAAAAAPAATQQQQQQQGTAITPGLGPAEMADLILLLLLLFYKLYLIEYYLLIILFLYMQLSMGARRATIGSVSERRICSWR